MSTPQQDPKRREYVPHYDCDDCWYSCPQSSEGCCNHETPKDVCTCGADKINAEFAEKDARIAELEAQVRELESRLERVNKSGLTH